MITEVDNELNLSVQAPSETDKVEVKTNNDLFKNNWKKYKMRLLGGAIVLVLIIIAVVLVLVLKPSSTVQEVEFVGIGEALDEETPPEVVDE